MQDAFEHSVPHDEVGQRVGIPHLFVPSLLVILSAEQDVVLDGGVLDPRLLSDVSNAMAVTEVNLDKNRDSTKESRRCTTHHMILDFT